MTFEIEQFKHLTKASCETMLGWTVEQLDRRPSPAPEEPTVRSWVSLSGAFSGVLSMECSVSLAERAAAAMLGDVEASSLSTDEVHDCFGELANILGGNVKELLPSPTHLSLPSVEARPTGEGREAEEPAEVIAEAWLLCGEASLRVSVHCR